METLVGFAVGFVVGTREGKEGLNRIFESLSAIRDSSEFRNLLGEATTVLAPMVRELARATGGS